MNDCDRAERAEGNAGTGGEVPDHGDKALGGSAAGEADLGDEGGAFGKGDGAGSAAGINKQEFHGPKSQPIES